MELAQRIDVPNAARGRVLPHSQEAEESVVGGILLYSKAFIEVAELVTYEDFYHPALAAIFAAMVELDQDGKPIDVITVGEQMRANDSFGKLRAFNGDAYFAELTSKVVTVENLAYHAKIVRGKATVRRLIEAAQGIAAHGYAEYGDVEAFVEQAEQSIFEIAQRSQRSNYVPGRKILGDVIKQIETAYDRKQLVTGVPTGYHKLDAMTCGFKPAELIIIAARPSMGKTALVMNIVMNAAINYGVPALVFSLEMSKESLMTRNLCSEARVDAGRVQAGMLDQRDWINLTKASGRISEAPLWIDDQSAPTLLEIRAKARRWRADRNVFTSPDQLGIVVVDYLQLIQAPAERGHGTPNREQEVAAISKGLKALAKDLRVPVVALSQLNRSVEARRDKRPTLADLRDSGQIEQDADIVAFIYRDEVYNKDTEEKGVAEIILGKQRNNPIGTIKLAFLNQYTKFENLSALDD